MALKDKGELGSLIGRLVVWFEGLRLIPKRFVNQSGVGGYADIDRSTGPKMESLFQLLAKTHSMSCDFQERTTSQLYRLARFRMMELRKLSKLSQTSTRGKKPTTSFRPP